MKVISVVALICMLFLASCATRGQTGAAVGGAAGAAIGQVVGKNTGGTLIGAAVGTLLGYLVGNEMDKYDREQLDYSYERAPSNQRSTWVNPDTGREYAVTPQPAYKDSRQRTCRKAEIEGYVDGRRENTISTACRTASGQWELQ